MKSLSASKIGVSSVIASAMVLAFLVSSFAGAGTDPLEIEIFKEMNGADAAVEIQEKQMHENINRVLQEAGPLAFRLVNHACRSQYAGEEFQKCKSSGADYVAANSGLLLEDGTRDAFSVGLIRRLCRHSDSFYRLACIKKSMETAQLPQWSEINATCTEAASDVAGWFDDNAVHRMPVNARCLEKKLNRLYASKSVTQPRIWRGIPWKN